MDLNYNSINLFPTIIHQFDVNGFDEIQNQLIDYAYEFKNKNPEGVKFSNYGGWQSHDFIINNNNDLLHSFLINCLFNFPNIHKSINFSVDAWININKPGDYNIKHHHPTCDLSGVVWLKVPQNSGVITFENPVEFQTYNLIQSHTEEYKESNNFCHTWFFKPIEGRMIVFPSHLLHDVGENKSNEDRISVSFNIRLQ